MNIKEKFLVFLSLFQITKNQAEGILNEVSEALNTFDSFKENEDFSNFLSGELFHEMCEKASEKYIDKYLSELEKKGIICLTIESENYPQKLRSMEHPPRCIYAKGNLDILNLNSVGIVGSRMPSSYGKVITEKFAKELASAGLVIVSGLAYGVDTISHLQGLKYGKTIAVLGGGFNNIYPASNSNLSEDIAKDGLLISEYMPSFRATKFSFPERNKIIAALSDAVLITEASDKSGSLYTKNAAIEYGKDVFAVPGNITSAKSEGTNRMLKYGQAYFATDSSDILEKFNLKKKEMKVYQPTLEEAIILKELENGEIFYEILAKNTNFTPNILNSCLTTLEIRGIIRKLPGNLYSIS